MLDGYRRQHKFAIHEFVIMPDHIHLMLTVNRDTSIERAVQWIKGGFSFRAGKELGFHASFWQKGFSEVRVSDEATYDRSKTYIRSNPVKAGLVASPEDFPFSSTTAPIALDPRPQGLKPAAFWNALRYG